MSPRFWVVIFLAIFHLTAAQEHSLLYRTHVALRKTLDFLLEDYKEMNVDCLFGVTLGHVHLENAIGMKLNKYDLNQLRHYKAKVEEILKLAKPLQLGKGRATNVFVNTLLIPERWHKKISFKDGLIDPNFSPNVPKSEVDTPERLERFETAALVFNESGSDACLMQVLKSESSDAPHNCTISKWCIRNMVADDQFQPAYSITHRLLLLQVASSQKCLLNRNGYDEKVRSYCSYIYWEIRQNVNVGFIDRFDDLLMEQITLCAYEGFGEFINEELIEHILAAQTEHGCFSVPMFYQAPRRSKRTANLVKYGCNDHSTGLGFSTFSIFLLYLYQIGETL